MRFSANLSMLFTEVPMPERFALAREQGFSAVEIQFPYQWPATAIKQWLDENALTLVLFNVDADNLLQGGEGLAAVPAKRQEFRAALQLAAEYATVLQPSCINVLPGRCLQAHLKAEYWHCLIDNLRLACEVFAEIQVTTVVEAINSVDMPGFMIDDHAGMLQVLRAVNHPQLKLQYDIYHMAKMQQDILGFWREHLQKIAHIQFADCPGRHEPGTGQLDFSCLFADLDRLGYQGFLGAEYKPQVSSVASLSWFKAI